VRDQPVTTKEAVGYNREDPSPESGRSAAW